MPVAKSLLASSLLQPGQGNRFGWRRAALPVRLHQVIESAKLSADIPATAARFRATWAVVQTGFGFLNELRSWQRGVQKRRLAERAAGGSSCEFRAARPKQCSPPGEAIRFTGLW